MSIEVIKLRKLGKLADLCWEGLTLQHVSHKEIVIPYKLFVFLAFLFELFLAVLFVVSSVLFHTFGYKPNFEYYVSVAILIFMLLITVPMLITLMSVHHRRLTGGPHR